MRKSLKRWVRFFEVSMPDSLLPVVVGVAMAWSPGSGAIFWARAALALLLLFLCIMFVHGSDSIVGYQRGVDQQVYLRKGAIKREKPLVTGEVSLSEARLATGLVLGLLLITSACYVLLTNWRVGALTLGTLLFLCQYSVGLRLSYRGLGEATVSATGLGTPIAYGFLTGALPWEPFLIGLMLGLWQGAANVASNHADYQDDRTAGRRTLAVLIGLTWHRRVAVLMLVLGWGLFGLLTAMGMWPVLMIPLAVLGYYHVRQVRLLREGQPLAARKLGFATFRKLSLATSALLLLSHLLQGG